jgi:two-component system response regulator CpxR
MSAIALFSGSYCKDSLVVEDVLKRTGYTLVTDKELVSRAAGVSDLTENKIERVFSGRTSVFNKFTHEQGRSIALLRHALAKVLSKDDLLIHGFCGMLVPRDITHVLRVCLVGDMPFRASVAQDEDGVSEKEALKLINKCDTERAKWIDMLYDVSTPWDASLYDIVIPMDKRSAKEAGSLIVENLQSNALSPTRRSRGAVLDFQLAAQVELALVEEGHDVSVTASNGAVTLTINKHVLMLHRLEEELKPIASKIAGVKSVKTKVGKGFYQTDIYRKYDFEMPSKVLLVDDERQFVETLSERLMMRKMGSAIAYDGESALELIKEEEPEVMILDLKMPGIDGMEVLRRIKATGSDIEVIILTGHGSEADRETCMQLGAFAYLTKPVDINELTETLKAANEKIKGKK